MRWRFTEALAVASVIFGLTLPCVAFAQEQTRVGNTSTYCAAQTVVGATTCKPEEQSPKKVSRPPTPKPISQSPAAPSPEDPMVGGVRESEVTEFLANHGKPSREAVRALLNPTDQNIASMLKVERSQLAIAAYVGQRRVELTKASTSANGPELRQSDLPEIIGMRLSVVVGPDCQGCEQFLPIVNQVVTEFPSVDARIGVVGMGDAKLFISKMANLGVFLPSTAFELKRARSLGITRLPAFIVGDTRYGREAVVSEIPTTALELVQLLISIRRESERSRLDEVGQKRGVAN